MEKFGVGELFLKEITYAQYIFAEKYSKKTVILRSIIAIWKNFFLY